MTKKFHLDKTQIRPLATGYGACIATDMITVEGKSVGYMVREFPHPDHPEDSGWLFTSGEESQVYMDDANHHGVYDVNTIANYCPEIITLLDAPPQSAFARNPVTGKLEQIDYEEPLD